MLDKYLIGSQISHLDSVDRQKFMTEAEGSDQAEDERDGEVLAAEDPLPQLLEALVPPETVEQVDQPALRQPEIQKVKKKHRYFKMRNAEKNFHMVFTFNSIQSFHSTQSINHSINHTYFYSSNA